MKRVTVMQQPIEGHPEYDSLVTRNLPEMCDLATWADSIKQLILDNCAVDEHIAVEHIAVCSTPPLPCGLQPNKKIAAAQQQLMKRFGVNYIVL